MSKPQIFSQNTISLIAFSCEATLSCIPNLYIQVTFFGRATTLETDIRGKTKPKQLQLNLDV